MGEEEVLEESGGSGGGPAGAGIPAGWRACWAGSVRQTAASLGGVRTGGAVTSVADWKKKEFSITNDGLGISINLRFFSLFAVSIPSKRLLHRAACKQAVWASLIMLSLCGQ